MQPDPQPRPGHGQPAGPPPAATCGGACLKCCGPLHPGAGLICGRCWHLFELDLARDARRGDGWAGSGAGR